MYQKCPPIYGSRFHPESERIGISSLKKISSASSERRVLTLDHGKFHLKGQKRYALGDTNFRISTLELFELTTDDPFLFRLHRTPLHQRDQ